MQLRKRHGSRAVAAGSQVDLVHEQLRAVRRRRDGDLNPVAAALAQGQEDVACGQAPVRRVEVGGLTALRMRRLGPDRGCQCLDLLGRHDEAEQELGLGRALDDGRGRRRLRRAMPHGARDRRMPSEVGLQSWGPRLRMHLRIDSHQCTMRAARACVCASAHPSGCTGLRPFEHGRTSQCSVTHGHCHAP